MLSNENQNIGGQTSRNQVRSFNSSTLKNGNNLANNESKIPLNSSKKQSLINPHLTSIDRLNFSKSSLNQKSLEDIREESKELYDKSDINNEKLFTEHNNNNNFFPNSKNKIQDGISLREFSKESLTSILLEGMKELGRKRPTNPIRFLGNYLLKNDPEK